MDGGPSPRREVVRIGTAVGRIGGGHSTPAHTRAQVHCARLALDGVLFNHRATVLHATPKPTDPKPATAVELVPADPA